LGLAGAWADVASTVDRRGNTAIPLDVLWQTIVSSVQNLYRWPVLPLVIWSMVSAPIVILAGCAMRSCAWWSPEMETRVLLAKIQVALMAGVAVSAVLLRGYFSAAYVGPFIPCLVFIISVGIASVGLDLAIILTTPLRRLQGRMAMLAPVARAVAFGAVAYLMVQNFGRVYDLYPPFKGEFVRLLETTYRDEPFVAPSNFHMLAYALSWGSTAPSPLVVTENDLRGYEHLRTADGRLYYLCVMHPVVDTSCDRAASEMTALGHLVTDRAADFVIMELLRDPVPIVVPPPTPTAAPAQPPANRGGERPRLRRNR
jgi:hypothetical protein